MPGDWGSFTLSLRYHEHQIVLVSEGTSLSVLFPVLHEMPKSSCLPPIAGQADLFPAAPPAAPAHQCPAPSLCRKPTFIAPGVPAALPPLPPFTPVSFKSLQPDQHLLSLLLSGLRFLFTAPRVNVPFQALLDSVNLLTSLLAAWASCSLNLFSTFKF